MLTPNDIIGRRFSVYQVTEILGAGGMGVVYLAEDTVLHRKVALKVPHIEGPGSKQMQDRFMREARAAAALEHPAICRVYEIGESEGLLFFAMEYVRGTTLADELKKGRLSVGDSLRIVNTVAEALEEAHDAGIIHRDLKPQNIMITAKGQVKVMDFGLSRRRDSKPQDMTMSLSITPTGMILGTPDHMAPEQARGMAVDGRADIFSLGVVLYELLTGINPFRGKSQADTISAIMRENPEPVSKRNPEVTPELDGLVARMLAKEPSERLGTMRGVCEELAKAAAQLGTQTGPKAFAVGTGTPAREAGRCASCGAAHARDAGFCGKCGARLPMALASLESVTLGAVTMAAPSSASATLHSGGRKQLTVMCCGLADFGGLSAKLDPEELHQLVMSYRQVCVEVAGKLGGCAARPSHRTIQIYFGHPAAFEDNAARAIKAALEIDARTRRLAESLNLSEGPVVASQTGIHTGIVIVGDNSDKEGLEFTGSTPDVAARLHELAGPGGIAVSDLTRQLTRGAFHFEPGEIGPAGQPVWFTAVTGTTDSDSPDSGQEVRKTPLAGRERETATVLDCWSLSQEGMGQVVLVSGEPGIGKSRMVDTAKKAVEESGRVMFECRCSPYHVNAALYPFLDCVERACKFEPQDSSQVRIEKLKAMLVRLDPQFDDDVVLTLAELLVMRVPQTLARARQSPEERKQAALNVFIRLILGPGERVPLALLVEDLHWADPTTIELLQMIVERTPETKVLTMLTFRPEFQHPFGTMPHLSQLTINRLTAGQIRKMVEAIAGAGALPEATIEQICAKSDGVPLFVEEVTRMVLESGRAPEELEIPATLRDSLMARLDRMPEAKGVAQVAAVLGREFSQELLAAIWPGSAEVLAAGLRELIRAGLLTRRGVGAQERLVFKHALIHDIAYESQLKATRQRYHQTVAEAMERDFPRIVEAQPDLIARHYVEAAIPDRSVRWLERASQKAIEQSAYRESINYLNQGLALVRAMPASGQRDRLELPLQVALGAPLIAARGYAAAEVEAAFLRARELSGAIGRPRMRFRAEWGLGAFSLVRARLAEARAMMERCLELAAAEADPGLVVEAESWLGTILFYLNDLAGARLHLDRAMEIYAPAHHREHAFLYGLDPAVLASVHLSWLHWLTGDLEASAAMNRRSLEIAEQTGHSLSVAHALNFHVVHHCFRGDAEGTSREAETEIALSNKHGFPHYLAYARILRGWALTHQGELERGIEEIRGGLALRRQSTGAELARPFFLSLLAEAYLRAGLPDESLRAVGEAHEVMERTGERWWRAEIQRIEGEVMGAAGEMEGALACLDGALGEATAVGADSLALRALSAKLRVAMAGAPELVEGGREALRMAMRRFPESAETGDLLEARRLTAE